MIPLYNNLEINWHRYQPAVLPVLAIAAIYVAMALWLVPGYFDWDANVYMGLLMAPYICTMQVGRYSLRYLWPTLVMLIVAVLLPVKTVLFAAMLFAVFLLIENSRGKISNVLLILLLLISPVFKHISRLVELPVRLWLSDRVATLFSLIGTEATSAGNQIVLGRYEFSVDPACAGLNMLVTSLLICLFVTTVYQRRASKRVTFIYLLVIASITIALNIACNFFRILMLVTFKAMPGTFMHDFIGIVCLLLYVILPLLTIIRLAFLYFGIPQKAPTSGESDKWLRYPVLHTTILAVIVFASFRITKLDGVFHPVKKQIHLTGFRQRYLMGSIIKLENQEALIYLKPTAFYAPEHDPTICWVGSGYRFSSVQKQTIGGLEVYSGTLQKGKEKLYTAWWFDDGSQRSINQLAWRWQAMVGEHPFYLVNVNAADPQVLYRLVKTLSTQHILQ